MLNIITLSFSLMAPLVPAAALALQDGWNGASAPGWHEDTVAMVLLLLACGILIHTLRLRWRLLEKNEELTRELARNTETERKLRERDASVRAIVENTDTVIFTLDSHGVFQFVEGHRLASIGLTPERLMGRPLLEIFSHRPDFLGLFTRCIGGERLDETVQSLGKVFHLVASPVPGLDGSMERVVGIVRDISEAEAVRRRLAKSEALLKALKESIPDLVWLKDEQGRYLTCNPAFERVYGRTESSIVGRTDHDVESSLDAATLCGESDRLALAQETPLRFEERLTVAETGEKRLFETIKTPTRDSEGNLIGVLGIARDITERESSEQALRNSEALLKALKESIPDLVWLKDANGVFLTCNPAFERAYGVKEAELVGRARYTLVDGPEQAESFLASDRKTLAENRPLRFEQRLVLAETGEVRLLETIKTPTRDSEGNLLGVLGVARDVTERRQREREVQDWMRRFAIINASARQLFYDYDLETGQVTWSGPINAMLGLEEGGLDGPVALWAIRLHPQDAPVVMRKLEDAVARCAEFKAEYRLRSEGEDYIHVHANGVFLSGPGGEAVRMLGILQDISARKSVETALAISEQKLRLLFSAAHDTILVIVDERIVECNASAMAMFQLERGGILGRTPADFSPPCQPDGVDSRVAMRRVLFRARAEGTLRFEWSHRRNNGEIFPSEITLTSMEVDGTDTLLAVMRDMTKRKQAEQLLRQSEEKFSKVFSMAPYGVSIVRLEDAVVLDANRAFETLTGHPRERILGRPSTDFGIWHEPARRAEFIARIQSEGLVVDYGFQLRRADGALRSAMASGQRLDIAGEACFINLIRDVTELKLVQQTMVQTEKMLSLGGLAAGMAHEINNPLGIIFQSTMGVQRRLDPALEGNRQEAANLGLNLEDMTEYLRRRNILRYLEGIREAGERAAGIVRNMLRFSRRSDSGMADQDLEGVVRHAISLAENDYDLRKHYDFKRIRIEYDLQPGMPPVPCQPSEIEQVLLNLLRNAAQAMIEAGTPRPVIRLRAWVESGHAVLEISDNGPGIPKERQNRVFEPFYTTKKVGEGTGLGLSVSYFIVTTTHRGSLVVASEPGQGARFTLRLPLTRSETAS